MVWELKGGNYSCNKSEGTFPNSWSSSVLRTGNRGISCEFCSATFSYRELPICLNQKQQHVVINGKHGGGRWDIKTNNEWWWCENKFSMALLTLVNNTTWGGLIGNTLPFVKQIWMAALKCRKSYSCQATLPDILLSYEIPPLTWQSDMNGMSHPSEVILNWVPLHFGSRYKSRWQWNQG